MFLQALAAEVDLADRQQRRHLRLLAHRADELVAEQEQPVDVAVLVGLQHQRDRADQVVHARPVAEMRRGADDVVV